MFGNVMIFSKEARSCEYCQSPDRDFKSIESGGNYTVKCGFNSLHKDAKSALRRATTPQCLQLIADTACANEKGSGCQMAIAGIFRLYVFGPLGVWTMAPLRCKI